MGAGVRPASDGIEVAAGPLVGIDADLSGLPDQVPTLAALAPFARGATRIRNVPHLRLKESDRLAVMARELARLGVPVEEQRDGLTIPGCWAPPATPPSAAAHCEPEGDHRIAMSLALVALRRPGMAIAHPEVVAKSYPDFWRDFESLLGP
jgi:3-phosphoshikimate 1-carboxyvinyltransferase